MLFPIVHNSYKIRFREQFETNQNDENTMVDYPNIDACVSDYMKIYHDRFWTFYGHSANEAR